MTPTSEQIETANNIGQRLNVKKVFVNDSGEFFTDENLALNSVKFDKKKVCDISVATTANTSEHSESEETGNSNDTDKDIANTIKSNTKNKKNTSEK